MTQLVFDEAKRRLNYRFLTSRTWTEQLRFLVEQKLLEDADEHDLTRPGFFADVILARAEKRGQLHVLWIQLCASTPGERNPFIL